jgi:hypothetical protein
MHQPEYAHEDQVDRHDVVEQPWLDQDQDARDQGDYWLYGDSHQLRHGVLLLRLPAREQTVSSPTMAFFAFLQGTCPERQRSSSLFWLRRSPKMMISLVHIYHQTLLELLGDGDWWISRSERYRAA